MRGWAVVVVAGLVMFSLVSAIFLTSRARDGVTWVEGALRDGLAPLMQAANRLSRTVTGLWTTAAGLRHAHEENERLRAELAALREENYRLQEYRRENEALRAVLGLTLQLPAPTISAEVIARPLNNWWSVLIINKGSRDGVEPLMGVVSPDGVVGHVRSVNYLTSEVILLTDPRSAVGGIVQRTGQPVLVEGFGYPGTHLRLRPLVAAADIQPGDIIVTSGMSQLFDKGIPIGKVDEVDVGPYGMSVEATVRPFVDFGKLEFVTVLGLRPETKAQAQADGEAPAGAGRR
ncbi:MAG: rod shape-determining protein MreC [Bacillota bacterium]|nr:rod shape-determining protein MreC [Bacillota bacterium]REJ36996.1 MAG: rod shape-determining protein MreC [Bacillota bacterium]